METSNNLFYLVDTSRNRLRINLMDAPITSTITAVLAGQSVRIFGVWHNRREPMAYDLTFRVGDGNPQSRF